MRRILFAMLLVAAPRGVSDLTWGFSEGWAAQEGSATATMVSSESMVSSARLDADSTQSQPSVVIITGEVQNPRSRKITFRYESPAALESSEEQVTLDSLDRFAFEVPVVRGTSVSGYFEGGQPRWQWVQWLGLFLFERRSLSLFVEPGDSLHVAVEEGFFGPSYSFSGSNADNSRFTSEWIPQFYSLRLDRDAYKGLGVEDFKRLMEQWRRDQFEFLATGREQYALSSGCIDYVTSYVNYEWAIRMVDYPSRYQFANGRENRDITPEYYDFLQEFPLVDEKAIGIGHYRWFLERTLDRDHDHDHAPKLSKIRDLSGLELSEETQAQLDSLYEKEGRQPVLSKMVDLSAFGVSASAQAQVDSLYEKEGRWLKLSERYDLSAFGVAESAHAQLDSLYEKSDRPLNFYWFSEEEKPKADTTGGELVLHIPSGVRLDSLAKEPPKLSAKIDLSDLGLSEAAQAQLDSMYEHRQPLVLSAKIDLSGLKLPEAALAQLDSIYAGKGHWFGSRYNLAKEKLEGRVLYWFLAGELINTLKRGGSEAFAWAQHKWEEFQQINPHPEYNEAVLVALSAALKLQPGQLTPDFTLDDLDGQPVSLSQFKGQVVLIDFWASWCGPCIDDLPYLRQVKKKTADWPVVFLNISLDADEDDWREAIDEHEIKGVHVRADGWGAEVAKTYQVMGIPSYYLVDSQGLIVEDPGLRGNTEATVAAIEKSL